MHGSYDDMRDMQYREENPGYEREVGLTASDLADCDPEVAVLVAESYARDNAGRRENNLRTRISVLETALENAGIEIPEG
jgi:hypothetical protein